MRDDQDKCERLRRRISEKQRRATELSIEVKLEAEDSDDIALLAETADLLEVAVEELERARSALASP